MKLSELIGRLYELLAQEGDMDVAVQSREIGYRPARVVYSTCKGQYDDDNLSEKIAVLE